MQFDSKRIPLQAIDEPIFEHFGVYLNVLRLDLTHTHISGNKWFKLKYNLQEAKKEGHNTLLTFGGAFSNHIAATAAAGKECGFNTIGIIRGEEQAVLNPTLQFALDCGMQLHYVSRSLYRDKDALYNYVKEHFQQNNAYVIPEGGSNVLGVKGCTEIMNHIHIPFDVVCCAAGTGATLAGLVYALKPEQKAIGFQVLKAEGYIKNEVANWLKQSELIALQQSDNPIWEVSENYHFGGYAKVNDTLKIFVENFSNKHQMPLDAIYTGKMMFGVYDLIQQGCFKKGTTIIAIHTGGLQGNKGFYDI
jgi:1-aminocyclopropane-1-carboxylate deaminase